MRALSGLSALFLLLGSTAAIAGNVLLPSGDSAPNLGLVPKTETLSTTATTPAVEPVVNPTTIAAPPAEPAPAPAPQQAITDNAGYSAPTTDTLTAQKLDALRKMGITPKAVQIPPEILKVREEFIRQSRANIPQIPAQITEDTGDRINGQYDLSNPLVRASGIANTKYTPTGQLKATFVGYAMGPSDYEAIQSKLGYTPKQAQSVCTLRLAGMISSGTDDTSSFSLVPNQMKQIPFTLPVNTLLFSPEAVCEIPRGQLPPNSSITKVGNKYSVSTGPSTNCTVPVKGFANLKLQYTGNGALACVYTD